MPFITFAERHGFEKGEEQGHRKGLLQGIELGLKLKFGPVGDPLLAELRQQTDVGVLEKVLQAIESTNNMDDLRKLLP